MDRRYMAKTAFCLLQEHKMTSCALLTLHMLSWRVVKKVGVRGRIAGEVQGVTNYVFRSLYENWHTFVLRMKMFRL